MRYAVIPAARRVWSAVRREGVERAMERVYRALWRVDACKGFAES